MALHNVAGVMARLGIPAAHATATSSTSVTVSLAQRQVLSRRAALQTAYLSPRPYPAAASASGFMSPGVYWSAFLLPSGVATSSGPASKEDGAHASTGGWSIENQLAEAAKSAAE